MRSRVRRGRAGDRGSAVAEFAVAMPAVVLVLGLCLAGVQAGALHVRLQDAVADAARTVARGDSQDLAVARVTSAVPEAALVFREAGEFVCVDASAPVRAGGFDVGVTATATGCALAGGG